MVGEQSKENQKTRKTGQYGVFMKRSMEQCSHIRRGKGLVEREGGGNQDVDPRGGRQRKVGKGE